MEKAYLGHTVFSQAAVIRLWGKQNQGGQARARVSGEDRQVRERGLWVVSGRCDQGIQNCMYITSRALGSQHPQGCLRDTVGGE